MQTFLGVRHAKNVTLRTSAWEAEKEPHLLSKLMLLILGKKLKNLS